MDARLAAMRAEMDECHALALEEVAPLPVKIGRTSLLRTVRVGRTSLRSLTLAWRSGGQVEKAKRAAAAEVAQCKDAAARAVDDCKVTPRSAARTTPLSFTFTRSAARIAPRSVATWLTG